MPLPDLATLDQVKTFMGESGTAKDAVLSLLITGASSFIRGQVSRTLTAAAFDIRRSGRGTSAMQLPEYPILSVSLVEVDGRAIPAAPNWSAPGYSFDEEQIVLRGYAFTEGVSNVRVAFTAGYAEVPESISLACAELVTLKYKMRDKLDIASKSLANESISFNHRDMPSSVKTALQPFKRIAPL
jgi:hypothetical protein